MFNHHLIKRSLAAGVVIAAAGLPTTAQALIIQGPSGPAGPVTSEPSAPLPIVTTHSSFQWGDAGIGAAAATALLGAGALGAGATRRRRTVAG
jgi:hypothetical protein